jgi:Flp pilus assembly protein TadG
MRSIRQLHRDERGLSFVFVAIGITGFVAATTLAIDVGMLMTARTQAQNAADAGALAGATALAFNSFDDRSTSGPAVQGAMNAALANKVVGQSVSILSSDVTFPVAPSGASDRVKVAVFRTVERGNAVGTMVAGLFGVNTADIKAVATAEAILSNSAVCVKPWAIPDRWTEVQTPGWDVTDTFTAFPSNPSVFPDIFRAANLLTYTGYKRTVDVGTEIKIMPESSPIIEGDMYFPIAWAGATTVDDYINNITGCESPQIKIGDGLNIQAGVIGENTGAGAAALIAADPTAYWDATNKKVVSPLNPSPRVIVIPVYDPMYFDQGKRVGNFTQLRVSNFIGFFVDHLVGNNVVGKIMPALGQSASGTSTPQGAFLRAIRLVE